MEAIKVVMTGDLAHVKARYPRPLQVLGDIARSMVMAAPGRRLVGADYSNLESRVLSWCAGEDWKLNAYAKHDVTQKDEDEVYRITASRVLGIPIEKVGKAERKIGKVCDLGLGYCAGHRGLATQLRKLTEDQRKHLVHVWRKQHPGITALWDQAQIAAVRCVKTKQPTTAGPFTFSCDNMFLKVLLPSGRIIYFAFPKLMKDSFANITVTYMSRDPKTKKWGPCNHGRGSYGGLIVQNLIQGLSRDLISGAMLRVEKAGYACTMTCHDELTAEVDEDFGSERELVQIMTEQPSWAAGLPLNAKGWEGQRYG